MNRCAVCFLPRNFINVANVFFTINTNNFTNVAFVVSFNDLTEKLTRFINQTNKILVLKFLYRNFVVFSDRNRTNVIFLTQFFAQRRRHNFSANMRRRSKMSLAILSSRTRHKMIEFHLLYKCI